MVCMRKIKKILTLILTLSLLMSVLSVPAAAVEEIEYTSTSVIVTELVSGTTIISEQPDMKVAPGKIVKMAALYVISKACFNGSVSLEDEITITKDVMTDDNGVLPLKEGETFTLEQLMYLFYMDYSNTALYAAAQYTFGTYEAFISEMNGAMISAGCQNTAINTLTGYYNEEQYTTPEDIVLFLKMAIQNTVFKNVFSAASYVVPENEYTLSRSLVTDNLVQRMGGSYGLSYCTGGKQGGSNSSGYVTVTLSEKSTLETENSEKSAGGTADTQMALIVITAGAPDSDTGYKDAYNLIQWTFSNFSWNTVIHKGETVERVPVKMANGTDYVVVGPEENVTVLLDNSITPDDFEKEVYIYPPENGDSYIAPISHGEVLGELTLKYNGEIYGRVPLIANSDIQLKHWEYFKSEVKKSFSESKLAWIVVLFCLMLAAYVAYSVLFFYKRSIDRKKASEIRQNIIKVRRSGGNVESTAAMPKKSASAKDTIFKDSDEATD